MKSALQFGEHELLARLHLGSRTDIYLARRRGPPEAAEGTEIDRGRFFALTRLRGGARKALPALAEQLHAAITSLQAAPAPTLPAVVEQGEHEGQPYFLRDYFPGRTLHYLLKKTWSLKSPLPLPLVRYIGGQLLGSFPERRPAPPASSPLWLDLNPQNILLAYDGAVYNLDLGLGYWLSTQPAAEPTSVKGRLPYLSPEEVGGARPDQRSLLFSLGIILYELLTNRRLFWSTSDGQTRERILSAAPPPLDKLRPGLPPELVAMIHTLLQRDPSARSVSLAELEAGLQVGTGLAGKIELAAFLAETLAAERGAEMQRLARFRAPPAVGEADAEPNERTAVYTTPPEGAAAFEPSGPRQGIDDLLAGAGAAGGEDFELELDQEVDVPEDSLIINADAYDQIGLMPLDDEHTPTEEPAGTGPLEPPADLELTSPALPRSNEAALTDPGPGSGKHRTDAGSGSGKHRADAGSGSGKHRTDAGSGSGKHRTDAGTGSGKQRADAGSGSGKQRRVEPVAAALDGSWGDATRPLRPITSPGAAPAGYEFQSGSYPPGYYPPGYLPAPHRPMFGIGGWLLIIAATLVSTLMIVSSLLYTRGKLPFLHRFLPPMVQVNPPPVRPVQ